MKQKHAFLILSIACIPAILHAANLYINLINFPSFGDDFQYLQLVEYVQHHSIYENVNAIFQPHNQIHRIAYGRLMMLISYCFWGFIDSVACTMIWLVYRDNKKGDLHAGTDATAITAHFFVD